MLELRPRLGLGFFDLAERFAQGTVLVRLWVDAASSRNLPNDWATFMVKAIFDSYIAVVSAGHDPDWA